MTAPSVSAPFAPRQRVVRQAELGATCGEDIYTLALLAWASKLAARGKDVAQWRHHVIHEEMRASLAE